LGIGAPPVAITSAGALAPATLSLAAEQQPRPLWAGTLGGWWLKVVWDALKDLQEADKALVEKVASIEVLVAGRYTTREEFDRNLNAVFVKLDRIYELLSQKADR